jgi:phosphoribosyl 1,2-cyclic phosphodiesterase
MTMLHSLASSSSGNLYTVTDGRTSLLLECGLPFDRIKYLLSYRLHECAACLLTHSHKDHAMSARKLVDVGIPIWCSGDTARALGIEAEAERAVPRQELSIGTFRVVPFAAVHDVPCLGYLIYSTVAREKLLFCTDTQYMPDKAPGLTEIAVECNHSRELLMNGHLPDSEKRRIMQTHMSIETFLGFLQANDLSKVQAIYLLHMSDARGDAEGFKRQVQEQTGIITTVC